MRLLFLFALLPSLAFAEHPMLRDSGLPIPRYVTLKSAEINLRVGPGVDYPISWIYHRKGYPMEVVQEFGHWRKLRDMDGMEGWVHGQLISGERAALIMKSSDYQRIPAFAQPTSASRLVMEMEAGAVVKLLACQRDWCKLSSSNGRSEGWSEKRLFWGAYKDEAFED